VYGVDCAVSDPFSADTDLDGVPDPLDLYPRDPFPPTCSGPTRWAPSTCA